MVSTELLQRLREEKLDEEFLREHVNEFTRFEFLIVSEKQDLSEKFIRDFADKLDWVEVLKHQSLSQELISDFEDVIRKNTIAFYKSLQFKQNEYDINGTTKEKLAQFRKEIDKNVAILLKNAHISEDAAYKIIDGSESFDKLIFKSIKINQLQGFIFDTYQNQEQMQHALYNTLFWGEKLGGTGLEFADTISMNSFAEQFVKDSVQVYNDALNNDLKGIQFESEFNELLNQVENFNILSDENNQIIEEFKEQYRGPEIGN